MTFRQIERLRPVRQLPLLAGRFTLFRGMRVVNRQFDGKRASLSRLTVDKNLAPVVVNDLVTDR
jgi:hypothetical protein